MRRSKPALPPNTEIIIGHIGRRTAASPVEINGGVSLSVNKAVKVHACEILANVSWLVGCFGRREILRIQWVCARKVFLEYGVSVSIQVSRGIGWVCGIKAISVFVTIGDTITIGICKVGVCARPEFIQCCKQVSVGV